MANDLDLGFVKKNPWIVRDREQRKAAAHQKIEESFKIDPISIRENPIREEKLIEELEYGPGYVKKTRDYYLALSNRIDESPSLGKSKIIEENRKIDIKMHSLILENSGLAENQNDFLNEVLQAIDRPSKSIADMVMEQVEKMGLELSRSGAFAQSDLIENRKEIRKEKGNKVKSIKDRFEFGGLNLQNQASSDSDENIAQETRRDQEEEEVIEKKIENIDLKMDANSIDHHIAEENQFTITEGFSHPPPTPYPHSTDIMDFFDTSIHPPQFDSEKPKVEIFTKPRWHGIDLDKTIRPNPVILDEETPSRPPDFGFKKPRRVPSPTKRMEIEEKADFSALVEMKDILSKFQKKRIYGGEPKQPDQHVDFSPSIEILPNDPSPSISVVSKTAYEDYLSISDDSLEINSENENDEILEAKLLDDAILDRDRLRPIVKKRKIKFEVIGGGLVPRKTSLSTGPKFDGIKALEFSDDPPKAYAYLDESFVIEKGQWIPGEVLSMKQYEEIRDESKQERYKKFLASSPYYALYNEPDMLADPTSDLHFNGYYPPVKIDDIYMIDLRSPLPPPHPSTEINTNWYDLNPPPAYPFPISS